MDQKKIGKFIFECRKKKNLTQLQLAKKLYISDRAVSKWENGKCMPDLNVFNSLCNELDISINELLSGEYIPNNLGEINDKNLLKILKLYLKLKKDKKIYFGLILIILGEMNFILSKIFETTTNLQNFFSGLFLGFSVGINLIGIFLVIQGFVEKNKIEYNRKK